MFCVSPLTSCLNKKAAPPTTPRLDERPILSVRYRHAHMTPKRVPPSAHGFPLPRNTLFSQSIDWIRQESIPTQLAPTLHPVPVAPGSTTEQVDERFRGLCEVLRIGFQSDGYMDWEGSMKRGVLCTASVCKHFEGKHNRRGFRHANMGARRLYPRGIRARLKILWGGDWFGLVCVGLVVLSDLFSRRMAFFVSVGF